MLMFPEIKQNAIDLKKLNNQFESKSIWQIYKMLDKLKSTAIENASKYLNCLMWLEDTKRYREDPYYENASFARFLEDKTGWSHSTYYVYRQTMVKYPKAVKEIGLGPVTRVVRNCPVEVQKEAIKKLTDIKPQSGELIDKDTQEVIEKYRRPCLNAARRINVREINTALMSKQKENEVLNKRLKEAFEQIEKLKDSVIKYKNKYNLIKTALEEPISKNDPKILNG